MILSPRRRRLLAAVVSAAAVLGALVVVGWLAHWPTGLFGSARAVSVGGTTASSAAVASASAPTDAMAAIRGLTSQNPATLRAALAAGYPVSAGDAAPAGTAIRVRPGTWQQRGQYATVGALVAVPGRAPLAETIYFVREGGRWRVLFADPA